MCSRSSLAVFAMLPWDARERRPLEIESGNIGGRAVAADKLQERTGQHAEVESLSAHDQRGEIGAVTSAVRPLGGVSKR
jgi:hypothetical protein